MQYDTSNASQAYSPELQKKALANREQRQKDFDGFVNQLKDLSKSEKPSKFWAQTTTVEICILTYTVWIAQKENDAKKSAAEQQRLREERDAYAADSRRLQQEIRNASQ